MLSQVYQLSSVSEVMWHWPMEMLIQLNRVHGSIFGWECSYSANWYTTLDLEAFNQSFNIDWLIVINSPLCKTQVNASQGLFLLSPTLPTTSHVYGDQEHCFQKFSSTTLRITVCVQRPQNSGGRWRRVATRPKCHYLLNRALYSRPFTTLSLSLSSPSFCYFCNRVVKSFCYSCNLLWLAFPLFPIIIILNKMKEIDGSKYKNHCWHLNSISCTCKSKGR